MKKLLPLILLVACADPNAELLAKYKNLEIDNKYANERIDSLVKALSKMQRSDYEKTIEVESCRARYNIERCKELKKRMPFLSIYCR